MASENDILVRTKQCKPIYNGDLAHIVSGDAETPYTWATKAKEHADEAERQAGLAEAAASAAAENAASADGSAQSASGSAALADSRATVADQRATVADQRATFAEQKAGAAASSAGEAASSASLAKDWATKETYPVEGSLYSSKEYAERSAASASASAESASAASGSAGTALAKAAAAAGSALLASNRAADAAGSAGMAGGYAASASDSAEEAGQARDKARQWATSTYEVEPGLYGARKYANDAAGSGTAAGESAAAAAESAEVAGQARDKSREWAVSSSAVEPGLYGARKYAADAAASSAEASRSEDKSEAWATSGTEVEPGLYGARKYASDAASSAAASAQSEAKAGQWAESTGEVEEGRYSAKKHALDAEASAAASEQSKVKAGQWADSTEEVEAGRYSAKKHAMDAQYHADRAETVVQAHAQDTSLHLSTQDRSDFNHINSLFHQAIPPGTVVAPDGAVPDTWFTDYFARNAQPGDATHPRMMVAPGNVFVSRVPFARKKSDGTWENTASAMDTTVYDEDTDIRLLDNSGLRHKCSTNAVENVDGYVGKKWAFYWARCNYIRDSYGVKWITAVEGETIGLPDGTTAVFDPAKPTGIFGPSIWTFCCLDTGWGTEEDGTPNFQLWGIGDSPWSALSAERKTWLTAHGVDETKYRPWSTGLWYDGTAWQRRSYIVDSAYCGTAEVDANGTLVGVSSKYNEPVVNNVSHNSVNNLLGNKFGGGVRACALSMVFDIVKNCTKNSQTIHYGMASNGNNGVVCAANTLNAGYVFPVASKGNFEVGCTVYLRTTTASSAGGTSYVRRVTNQIGRIVAIENRDIEVITSDPTVEPVTTEVQNKLCLVIDQATVEPFFARTTTAYATALTDEGTYACAYATQGIALAGETHMVIGKHDGYVSGTSGRHPYRVQGMEMMCGVYQCAADCVVIKGTGSLEITLPDGTTATPTTSEYVYLYAPSNVVHRQSGTLAQYISGGYVPVGIGTTTAGYIFNGYVDPYYGVWYITHTGASDHTGHADNSYMGSSPAEFLSGGYLNGGSAAGSAFLYLNRGLGVSDWSIGARD